MKARLLVIIIFHYVPCLSCLFFELSAFFFINIPKSKKSFEVLTEPVGIHIWQHQNQRSFLFLVWYCCKPKFLISRIMLNLLTWSEIMDVKMHGKQRCVRTRCSCIILNGWCSVGQQMNCLSFFSILSLFFFCIEVTGLDRQSILKSQFLSFDAEKSVAPVEYSKLSGS